jgi:hypothetical protein
MVLIQMITTSLFVQMMMVTPVMIVHLEPIAHQMMVTTRMVMVSVMLVMMIQMV